MKRMQQLAGIVSLKESAKFSFQGKFTNISNPQDFIEKYDIEPNSPLTKIVAQYIGEYYNFAITNNNGKFDVYEFRRVSQPGNSVGTFKTIEDAKKAVKRMDNGEG